MNTHICQPKLSCAVIVSDEHLFPTHKPPKKLLRKNFNNKSNEIKLYMLKDESVKEYSSTTHSIDYSSNTLSRNNTHSNNTVVYSRSRSKHIPCTHCAMHNA